jgi:hypothetical protein
MDKVLAFLIAVTTLIALALLSACSCPSNSYCGEPVTPTLYSLPFCAPGVLAIAFGFYQLLFGGSGTPRDDGRP